MLDLRRNSNRNGARWYVADNHCIGADRNIVTHHNCAEYLRAGANIHPIPKTRGEMRLVPVAIADGNSLADYAVIADDRAAMNDDRAEMLDRQPPADNRGFGDHDAGC